MRGEVVYVRGVTTEEKREIRRRARELGLRSENAYLLKLLRSDLAKSPEQSGAARTDIAKLIQMGGWPDRAPSDA